MNAQSGNSDKFLRFLKKTVSIMIGIFNLRVGVSSPWTRSQQPWIFIHHVWSINNKSTVGGELVVSATVLWMCSALLFGFKWGVSLIIVRSSCGSP